MPYTIRYVKGSSRPWKIVNKDRNEVVGSSTSKAAAQASIRAREMGEHSTTQYAKVRKKGRPK